MEWSLRGGSVYLKGKLAACEICSNEWKTGGSSSSSSRSSEFRLWYRKAKTGITLKVVHREARSNAGLAKAASTPSEGRLAWAMPNLSIENDPLRKAGFKAGLGFSKVDQGFSVSRRSSTAVEAGRSKAKKGLSSGGRIERRPFSSRRPKPSKPEDFLDRAGGEQQEGRRTAEEELNSTWQDAGLGDRRAGGKFLPDRKEQPKEAQRVGGWGRDKSMQRVVTLEQQQRESARSRNRMGNRPNSKNSTEAPVVKKKSKLYEGFDDDPSVIHPPEYYINGPYGPHAWKGVSVGKVVEGTFATNQVVFFSTVEDEADVEEREKANVAVDYKEMVARFDKAVGVQFFYAFARRRYGPRPDPWKDWTLVAQIAVESGEKFDVQGDLFYMMGTKTQETITQCVAWACPNLTYVRRPAFHLRLEPQEDFLKKLFDLLAPRGERDDTDSYYATLCRLVDVDLDASARRVRNGYEALDEEGKLECLKHVFTGHPVKILSSARYDRKVRLQQGLEGEDGLVHTPAEEETDYDSDVPLEDEDENDQAGQISEQAGAGSRERRGLRELRGESDQAGQILEPNSFAGSDSRRLGELRGDSRRQFQPIDGGPGKKIYPQKLVKASRWGSKKLYSKAYFRSAATSFSYSNLIEEIAYIRIYLCQKQSITGIANPITS